MPRTKSDRWPGRCGVAQRWCRRQTSRGNAKETEEHEEVCEYIFFFERFKVETQLLQLVSGLLRAVGLK